MNDIKVFIQNQRTKLYNNRKNNFLQKNENRQNTHQKLILFGNKIGLKNKSNDDLENSNNIDSLINYYGTSIKKKIIIKNNRYNSSNIIFDLTKSFNTSIPEIKKKY